MFDCTAFRPLYSTVVAELVKRTQVMSPAIRPVWAGMSGVVGEAYPVRCARGDSLMLHAAIYRARPGSIIVVKAGDFDYAVAGGNVCAVAQSRGIGGFVIDGAVRDIGEVRSLGFAVFARGVIPIPARQAALGSLNLPITCGGVRVMPGDVIVADEDGVVVVPRAEREAILVAATDRAAKEKDMSLESWSTAHQARIDATLRSKGFPG
jgi:4-hydroxy-4-methyl-2-oxoglutarate aldolase